MPLLLKQEQRVTIRKICNMNAPLLTSNEVLKYLSKALIIGVLFSCLVVSPYAYGTFENPHTYEVEFDLKRFLVSLLSSPLLLIPSIFIWGPTVMILMIVTRFFYKSVQRHILVWCICVPIVFWMLMGLLFWSGVPEISYVWLRSFIKDISSSFMLIMFLLPSSACSFTFYLIIRKKLNGLSLIHI